MRTKLNNPKRLNLNYIIGIPILVALIVGLVILAKPNQSNVTNSNKLKVVAAENFWGNIASQLGGKNVNVTSIITNPNADPHLYESSAEDAANVSLAKVVIVNGLGYDDFMNKLLSVDGNSKSKQIIDASKILGITKLGDNPHLWYNIPKVNLVAAAITESYDKADPSNKGYYQSRLTAFDKSLSPLLATINSIKSRFAGAPVAYTEPVPGYALQAAGLKVVSPYGFSKSIEDGDDPSPSDTYLMDNLITSKQIKVLLYNVQTVSPVTTHARQLAAKANVPIVGVSETMPSRYKTYQSWQQHQLNEIYSALNKN